VIADLATLTMTALSIADLSTLTCEPAWQTLYSSRQITLFKCMDRRNIPLVRTRPWPIVRRANEFSAIQSALDGQPATRGIVLSGDAGVGKTTLARSVTESLTTTVHWVAGTECARSIPLGIFAHLVGPATSRDPIAFLVAARDTIRSTDHTIIGVDDAHLLDHLSATLLHQLVVEGSVRMVATVRTGEPVPDAISSLWKDDYLRQLRLTPFDKRQCVGLTEQALGGRVEGLSADLIWDASGGNALFVRHLIEGALEAGTLRHVRGVWQLRGGAAVTSELASLVDARIERLPNDEAHAMRLLAFAEPLALDTLLDLAGEDIVERAERRGLIRVVEETDGLEVRFQHPLFGEVIRSGLGRAAPRRLKAELFRALDKPPLRGPARRIQLAELALDSDVAADADLFARAAHDAIALTDITLGERLARAAVSRGGGLVASELLARSLTWQGKAHESERVLGGYDPTDMTEPDLVRWGTARIANLRWSMGDADRADEVLRMLQARVNQPGVRLVVEGIASASQAFENRLAEAVASSQRVLSEPAASPSAVEWAVFGGALAAALMGRGGDVRLIVAHGRQVEHKVDGLLRYLAAFGEIGALTLAGEFDVAEARSADIVRISSPGQYLAWAMANVLAGTVEVARGRFASAVPRMEETVAALSPETTASWSFPAALLLAKAYCALGRIEPAVKSVRELRSGMGPPIRVFQPQLRIAEAWLAAAQGHVSRATALALEAADIARDFGQRAVELMALHDAARFGDRSCLHRVVEVASRIEGRLPGADAAHAAGLLACDAAMVAEAARQFEAIGALLSAADAAAQAAALFELCGDRRRSVEAAATAERLAVACGGAKTPALQISSHPLPLSTREREIANFVAKGWTNRDIAHELVVSSRTVEGHIYRACMKLDVSDREGLATLIRQYGRG
jgi:DNA-binding NarL/FixJ family response regulator